MRRQFHANGKLLLSGEYYVLHGARALVLPLKYGQKMQVRHTASENLHWEAYEQGNPWFSAVFRLKDLQQVETTDTSIALRLRRLLSYLGDRNPELLDKGLKITTDLEFDRRYGWGSSSTLISLLAQWSGSDPYDMQFMIFGGSGYDIAAAMQDSPFLFGIKNQVPEVTGTKFLPPFAGHLFFVYLGNKQDTTEAIRKFNIKEPPVGPEICRITEISEKLSICEDPDEFEELLEEHEKRLSVHLGRPTLKQERFHDYPWTVKSLGAWGGDFAIFVLRGEKEFLDRYLNSKGIIDYYAYDKIIRHL